MGRPVSRSARRSQPPARSVCLRISSLLPCAQLNQRPIALHAPSQPIGLSGRIRPNLRRAVCLQSRLHMPMTCRTERLVIRVNLIEQSRGPLLYCRAAGLSPHCHKYLSRRHLRAGRPSQLQRPFRSDALLNSGVSSDHLLNSAASATLWELTPPPTPTFPRLKRAADSRLRAAD
jgi:hypothetical protein